MPKVKVKVAFVGQPDEMAKYAGKTPGHFSKVEKKLTSGEKASYSGTINPPTEMEVSEARAKELGALGLIEGYAPKPEEAAPKEKAEVITSGNIKEKKTQLLPTPKNKKK